MKTKRKTKPVICQFNITGAKLCIYWKVYALCYIFTSWALEVSLCTRYFIHRNVDERGPGCPPACFTLRTALI
jgi:hypothetical protein